jgi:hypothetical protein
MAEFALVAPILILLFFGLTLACFYAFRAAAADWGIFITGVAEGSFGGPATSQARLSIVWPDIASEIFTSGLGSEVRQVNSKVNLSAHQPWVFGITLKELHRAGVFFRLWRFYPGPPSGDIE